MGKRAVKKWYLVNCQLLYCLLAERLVVEEVFAVSTFSAGFIFEF